MYSKKRQKKYPENLDIEIRRSMIFGFFETLLNITYQGYAANAYDTISLDPGKSIEIYQPAETFLPNGYRGSVTVTAKAPGAKIACIVNQTHGANQAAGKGDWSMSYNAP